MSRKDGNTPSRRRRHHKAMHSASHGRGHDKRLRELKRKRSQGQ